MLFSISGSTTAEMPLGAHPAKFCGVTTGSNSEGKPFLKWSFLKDDGIQLVGFTDTTDTQTPRPTNKLGRYAAALAGKPASEGMSIDDTQYVGRKYMCVVTPNKNGKPALDIFTPLSA
jgi:hypothetical protein